MKKDFSKEFLSKWNKKVALVRYAKILEKDKQKIKEKEEKIENRLHKARIFGFIAGDGSIHLYRKKTGSTAYGVEFFPDNYDVAKLFIEDFKAFYEKEPKIKILDKYYIIRIWSKSIYIDLSNTINLGTLDWEIPFNYLNDDSLKKEWLKAFFDCKAHVAKKMIQLQSVNEKGLKQVKDLLEYFEIESKIYKYERKNKNWNTNYLLCIMKKDSKEKFLKVIGFNHTKKLEKLQSQFANVA